MRGDLVRVRATAFFHRLPESYHSRSYVEVSHRTFAGGSWVFQAVERDCRDWMQAMQLTGAKIKCMFYLLNMFDLAWPHIVVSQVRGGSTNLCYPSHALSQIGFSSVAVSIMVPVRVSLKASSLMLTPFPQEKFGYLECR